MIILLLIPLISLLANAQDDGLHPRPAWSTHSEVWTRLGQPLRNLTCRNERGTPLQHCLWRRLGEDQIVIPFSESTGRPGAPSPYSRFGYLGDGLEHGSCGLEIKRVQEEDKALWECLLTPAEGVPFLANINVRLLKKPSHPQLLDVYDRLRTLAAPEVSSGSHDVVLSCFAEGGDPNPTFKWFIGTEEIENEAPVRQVYLNGRIYTGQNLTHFVFRREHDGQFLKCVLGHETVTEFETDYTASRQISIKYPPRIEGKYTPALVEGVGHRGLISVNVSSNPEPQVVWFVGTDPHINPSETRQKYQAHFPILTNSSLREYRLEFFKLEAADLKRTIRLRADNGIGSPAEVEIELTTSIQEAVPVVDFSDVFDKLKG